jgi:hypothetical protein
MRIQANPEALEFIVFGKVCKIRYYDFKTKEDFELQLKTVYHMAGLYGVLERKDD